LRDAGYVGDVEAFIELTRSSKDLASVPMARVIYDETTVATDVLLEDNNIYQSGEWFNLSKPNEYCPRESDNNSCVIAVPPSDWSLVPEAGEHEGLVIVRTGDYDFQIVLVGSETAGETVAATIELANTNFSGASSLPDALMESNDSLSNGCVDLLGSNEDANSDFFEPCDKSVLYLKAAVTINGADGVKIITTSKTVQDIGAS
ncbi:MAG: hypothetical protein AAFO91_02795, partial [Bacteroidota bacterium]